MPNSFASGGSALLKANTVIKFSRRSVKVEPTRLLAYNVINLTHINVDYCGLSFPPAEEPWREALDCELVNELLLEDLKIPGYVISAGLTL